MTTAAIYVRISSDDTGEGLGVARQEAECRATAEQLGWTVTEVYRDNDISAYSGKLRPGYERLLSDVEAGTVRGLIVWHADRLHRSPKELERFIDLAERTRLQVQTVQSGRVDLSSPDGRMRARLLGTVARYESEHKSARIRLKMAQNAKDGKPHGGHRPYGWEPGRMIIRESEAAVIREATSRILAGEPLRSIFRDLNARGLHNASGKPWTHPTFRNVLLHARHAGLREHNGQEVSVAAWPAIIPPETWRAVRRVLNDPDRVTTPGRGGRLHLLSGIAVCGVCGSPLRVGHSRSTEAYRCMASACVSRRRDRLEEYVEAVVIARLSRADAAALLAPEDDGGERERAAQAAERVRQRLDDAAASFASGVITARQLATITGQLRPELAALEAAAAPPPDRASVLGELVTAGDVAKAWEALSPDARRTVVRLLMEIKVSRGRRGPGFSTDGIEIVWR
ncbi:recombinase family protein [Micromonospora inositola]|uniref:Site-specific DNA recombinase n=1 Tax=Micromonospora inositola TaxID=47865 RepID=A0A1C5IPC2_9ACTN|nr:recombinase family protein [Micromonospora inositola]SCG60207.1 Site-specific DNA recombinase [Micromonospora inositola]